MHQIFCLMLLSICIDKVITILQQLQRNSKEVATLTLLRNPKDRPGPLPTSRKPDNPRRRCLGKVPGARQLTDGHAFQVRGGLVPAPLRAQLQFTTRDVSPQAFPPFAGSTRMPGRAPGMERATRWHFVAV